MTFLCYFCCRRTECSFKYDYVIAGKFIGDRMRRTLEILQQPFCCSVALSQPSYRVHPQLLLWQLDL